LTQETLLLSLFWRAAAAAKQAQQVFEAAASRHGFELKLLPKCAGDAAGREQLKAEGAVGHLPYGCTCRADFFFFFFDGAATSWCAVLGARLSLNNACCALPWPPAVGEGEYFVALLPDGSRLVHPIAFGERFPLSYGREVLAELAGVPER
jgi:hypothetical protein